jgi:hypothetical protein
MIVICLPVSLLPLLLLCAIGTAPTTKPSSSQPAADAAVGKLIRQLNDPDPQVREQATNALWSRGPSIEPALQRAAESGPPEAARRARSILRDFAYGLFPGTPQEIFEDLKLYRTGDLGQKQSAIFQLNSRGIPGLRVLLHLREEQHSPEVTLALNQLLDRRWHDVALLLLSEDKVEPALDVLAKAANSTPAAAQDYAALLAVTGKLAEKIDQLKGEALAAQNAALRLALARAAGDLPAARAAAEKIADPINLPYPRTLDSLLIEQGDWKDLAQRLEANGQGLDLSERFGYLSAYYRLADDQENFQKTAKKLADASPSDPHDYGLRAENLFLNGLPDMAEQLLLDHNDYLQVSNYLAARLELKKALELPELAGGNQGVKLLPVQARTAEALHFAGEIEKAKQILTDAAQENRIRNDLAAWASLIEAARQIGQPAMADEFCVTALSRAGDNDPLFLIFEKMRMGDGQQPMQWWRFLHRRMADQTVEANFHRLRQIARIPVNKQCLREELSSTWATAEV